jgi:hypothetical protein
MTGLMHNGMVRIVVPGPEQDPEHSGEEMTLGAADMLRTQVSAPASQAIRTPTAAIQRGQAYEAMSRLLVLACRRHHPGTSRLRPVLLPIRMAEDMIGLVRISTAPATRKDMPTIDRPSATVTVAENR